MNNRESKTIQPEVLEMFTKRNKCFMCKRRFDKPFILPVDNPERGKFQPNFNIEVAFHMSDTHGIPDDIFRQWIVGAIYGDELHEFGSREMGNIFDQREK